MDPSNTQRLRKVALKKAAHAGQAFHRLMKVQLIELQSSGAAAPNPEGVILAISSEVLPLPTLKHHQASKFGASFSTP